jgi:hypothetical protein
MRNAVRYVDLVHLGVGEPMAFEPSRGPANVTRLPLTLSPFAASTFVGGTTVEAGVHELKAAMMVAGLSGDR